jgi:hypothetical protein
VRRLTRVGSCIWFHDGAGRPLCPRHLATDVFGAQVAIAHRHRQGRVAEDLLESWQRPSPHMQSVARGQVRRPIDGGGLSSLACRSPGPVRSTREAAADVHCGSGSWGGWCLRMADYVAGTGATDGGTVAGGR